MKIKLIALLLALFSGISSFAQMEYLEVKAEVDDKIYNGGETHEVNLFPQQSKKKKPKNVILIISDGMGFSHLNAAYIANKGSLYLENFKHLGLSKTNSKNNFNTDSAAGGTALATGQKVNNGVISIDENKQPLETILEKANGKGLSTGLVATSAITHATPASFIAHQPSRNMYEEIAADFLKTDIDVFIGGGYKHFTERKDGRNLVNELKEKGYTVEQDISKLENVSSGKLAGLTSSIHNGRLEKRGNVLPIAANTAINILSNNKKGFFLMIEASQIDWGAHAGNTVQVVEEMLDFDRTVGVALEFAAQNKNTLIVVTADHETGGMTILNGDYEKGTIKGEYSTGSHTGMMVPVLAYGPGAENFTGIMDNTDINKKIQKLLID